MKRKIVCKVCKSKFAATREGRYTVQGKTEMFSTGMKLIECFDCPACGCQNTVNVRIASCAIASEEAPLDG